MLALLALQACDSESAKQNKDAPPSTALPASAKHLRPGDLSALRKQMSNLVVLDVRTPHEFAEGHIPGALNINIQAQNFSDEVKRLDPNGTYVVHCAAGSPNGRSSKATEELAALGFKNLYHLDGGYLAWSAQTKP